MNFRMTSYSDNFEDVVLRRAFPADARGFYIDVGAYDPVDHSVTKTFYDQGWRGINVEPNPGPYQRLCDDRARDVNLNLGLSNRRGRLKLYEAPGACWSVDPDLLAGWFGADRHALVERSVPVETLAEVCRRHVPEGVTIDFLKVDVEGHEGEVIDGGDWRTWRPKVVLVEANRFETWEPTLLDSGYRFALFDGVNRFYVREEDARLLPVLSVPANVSDGFLVFGYLKRIHELERELAGYEDLGRLPLAVARRLRKTARRHPSVTSALRSVYRSARRLRPGA